MATLDKYILKLFALNYVIAFGIMVSIYVFLDLFFNLDEFMQDTHLSFAQLLSALLRYYGVHMFLYFSQISGVILLFAMAFTLARLHRDNEFVAIVSSGVSLYRIALTIIVGGLVLNGAWLVNQELVTPLLAPSLAQSHRAIALNEPYGVWFLRDQDDALLSASRFDHRAGQMQGVLLMRKKTAGRRSETIMADRATWQAGEDGKDGVWRLERGAKLTRVIDEHGAVEIVREPAYSFRSDLSPDDIALRQSAKWIDFLSRRQLAELSGQDVSLSRKVARAIHNRFATPIVNMLILLIGIPVFLDRQPGSVVQSGGRCLLVCGACFLFTIFCHNFTSNGFPVLTAWLPLIALTPVAVLSLDRLKT